MNKCIGYAKPENWIPAAQNKRITDGGKGKIGVGEEGPAPSNSQFCCNFATPIKSSNLRSDRQVQGDIRVTAYVGRTIPVYCRGGIGPLAE
jgi:hypothetical protein